MSQSYQGKTNFTACCLHISELFRYFAMFHPPFSHLPGCRVMATNSFQVFDETSHLMLSWDQWGKCLMRLQDDFCFHPAICCRLACSVYFCWGAIATRRWWWTPSLESFGFAWRKIFCACLVVEHYFGQLCSTIWNEPSPKNIYWIYWFDTRIWSNPTFQQRQKFFAPIWAKHAERCSESISLSIYIYTIQMHTWSTLSMSWPILACMHLACILLWCENRLYIYIRCIYTMNYVILIDAHICSK